MIDTIIKCNVCGIAKGENNHWFVAIIPTDEDKTRNGVAFGPISCFTPGEDDDLQIEHICGQQCLHKRLDAWLNANTTTQQSKGDQQ